MNYEPSSENDALNPASQLRIEVHAGPLAGKGYPFSQTTIAFGRATDNDIVLDDAQVSRYHATLRLEGNEVIIEDLNSMNGVLVNGERIQGPHVLQPTETITIGTSVFGVTGFSAPSTVSMTAQSPAHSAEAGWSTYQSSPSLPQDTGQGSGNWLLWGGILLLVLLIAGIGGAALFIFNNNQPPATTTIPPSVIISSPVAGSQFKVGQEVIVQTTATDAANGITRIELWVLGQKQDEELSPVTSGQSPFTAVMQWRPQVPGDYILEVRAYNASGLESAPTLVNVLVEDDLVEAQPTLPPAEETPTTADDGDGIPRATIRIDLNVRKGPGTNYDIIGSLSAGTKVEVVGRNEPATWWQIVHPGGPNQRGWISAEFAPAQNSGNVPLVNTPPPPATPTESPTPTVPPTLTPTETRTVLLPPTATPTPTPTTSPNEPIVQFSANSTQLQAGECTTFSWLVTNVQAVFFEDEGVRGDDNGGPVTQQECPDETTTYTLRVTRLDGQDQIAEIEITVSPRIAAPADLTVEEVQTESVKLAWDDTSDEEDGFRVYNADDGEIIDDFVDGTITATIPNLNCNTTYEFYVVAYNLDRGESVPSNTVSATTLACP